ncbi:MAG: hypothetical protein K5780_03605 [Alphaproteobacteria bacterium]|nr:hypothetical protein [Alphaproteobacteria bacterium]
MNQKTKWIKFGSALILMASVGIGGFFLGKAVGERYTNYHRGVARYNLDKAEHLREKLVVAEYFQKEKNQDNLLNRSELEGLGEIRGTIM